MKIVIKTPYKMGKKIYNLIAPLAENQKWNLIDAELLAGLIVPPQNPSLPDSFLLKKIMVSKIAEKEYSDYILIGEPLANVEYDKILCLYPDVCEAQDVLLKLKFEDYFNIISNHYDFASNSEKEIVFETCSILNKKPS